VLRSPGKGEKCRAAQKEFIDLALKQSQGQ